VAVGQRVVGAIREPGLLVLVGVTHEDTLDKAAKLWGLRILEGKKSCADVAAPLLVISHITLYADTRKGHRPTWQAAAPGPVAEPLVDAVVSSLRALGARVETGIFGADMQVSLINDGPVTHHRGAVNPSPSSGNQSSPRRARYLPTGPDPQSSSPESQAVAACRTPGPIR
jgi:D-tyrosyl-tRNA(Tyr) deacylase